MNRAPSRHQLAIVLPLFVLSLVLSSMGVATPATVQPASVLVRSDGAYTQSGSSVVLEDGVHSISATGLVQARIGEYLLSVLHGTVQVTVQPSSVSVAAITAPAVLTVSGSTIMVPVRSQVSVRPGQDAVAVVPKNVPAHFFKEQLGAALMAEKATMFPTLRAPTAGVFLPASLLLPGAEKRTVEKLHGQTRFLLQQALYKERSTELAAQIEGPYFTEALQTAPMEDSAALLMQAVEHHREAAFIPAFQAHSKEAVLLSMMHPLIAEYSIAAVSSSEWDALSLADIAQLPRIDTAVEPLSSPSRHLIINALQAKLLASTTLREDVEGAAEVLAGALEGLSAHPVRLHAWQQELASIFTPYREAYDVDTSFLHTETTAASAIRAPVVEHPQEPVEVLDETELLQLAEHTLKAAGFMFIPSTVVRVAEGGMVSVQRVVVGTPNGDIPTSFDYNPRARTIENIEQNGQILPYSMNLEAYVSWLRQE